MLPCSDNMSLNMIYTATITSKRQLTIPAEVYGKIGLKKGDKVIISENAGEIRMKRAIDLLEELAGSVKIAKPLRGADIDKAISLAKEEYFSKKGDK